MQLVAYNWKLPAHNRASLLTIVGPATTQSLVVKFDGEICCGVLVDSASDNFPRQKKLENLLPNFAGSSPPISLKTSPTSLWKSLVPTSGLGRSFLLAVARCVCERAPK